MRGARFFFLAFLIIASAALVRADGVQIPVMDVSDPPCSEGMVCPNPVPQGQGIQFTTIANSTGDGKAGGIFMATNFGEVWTSLLFTFTNIGNVNCTNGQTGHRAFDFCSVSSEGSTTTIRYSCDSTGCGIPSGDIFTINLNDFPLTTGSWPTDFTIRGAANGQTPDVFVNLNSVPVPEPATFTLLGIAGLVALLGKRKIHRAYQSEG